MTKAAKTGFVGIIIVGIVGSLTLMIVHSQTYPLRNVIAQTDILDGATKLYQRSWSSKIRFAPGNDSYIEVMYDIRSEKADEALQTTPLLKRCVKKMDACTNNPTWRPRHAIVKTAGPNYQTASLNKHEDIKQLYQSFAADSDTLCTAYNVTHDKNPPTFNSNILCVNSRLHKLTYEYLSRHDSIAY